MTQENGKGFSISPDQIDASQHLWDAFGHYETEISAGYVIRILQRKGSWEPFTEAEIEAFYRESGHTDGFSFNALIDDKTEHPFDGSTQTIKGGWIVRRDDGKLEVTKEFVTRAFKSSPKK